MMNDFCFSVLKTFYSIQSRHLILLKEDASTAAEGTVQVYSSALRTLCLFCSLFFVSDATSSVTQQFESGFSRAGTSFCTLLSCKQSNSPLFAAPLKQA